MLLTQNFSPHEAPCLVSGKGFDPDGAYVRKYVPELAGLDERDIHAPWETPSARLAAGDVTLGQDYPHPIVVHAEARAHFLALEKAHVKG
jgi:deoxyribodipyrimidine photo-lyase